MPELLGSTTAGLHVPVILLVDVLGNKGTVAVPPLQNRSDVPNGKRGTVLFITTILMLSTLPQVPDAGVKV